MTDIDLPPFDEPVVVPRKRPLPDRPVLAELEPVDLPRIDMHRCSASMTTSTPRGCRVRSISSATCVVSRSCTWGRLA